MAAVLLFRTYIIKNGMQFFRKRAKEEKQQNIRKFGQKCTKFENIL